MKNVSSFNLNLLTAFDALMVERNVTRAGERVGLAQSSMSNALTRLRVLFDDELFVRTPDGMMPTKVALEVGEHVRAAIDAAEDAINVGGFFDPQVYKGEVVLLTNDLIELTVVPNLVSALEREAPGIHLKTHGFVREGFAEDLDAGRADLVLGAASTVPNRFRSEVQCEESFAGIARFDHPIFNEPMTLEAFMAVKHVLISYRADGNDVVDAALAAKGLTRKVAVSVSNFATIPPLVIETGLIAVLPRRLAAKADKELPVKMFDLPFDVPMVQLKLIWSKGDDRSLMSKWFRDLLTKTLAIDEC